MPKDYPLDVIAKQIDGIMRPGLTFYQKWTCAKCGDRVTGNTPNKLFTSGHHEECDGVTDITKTGCGFAVHFAGFASELLDMLDGKKSNQKAN